MTINCFRSSNYLPLTVADWHRSLCAMDHFPLRLMLVWLWQGLHVCSMRPAVRWKCHWSYRALTTSLNLSWIPMSWLVQFHQSAHSGQSPAWRTWKDLFRPVSIDLVERRRYAWHSLECDTPDCPTDPGRWGADKRRENWRRRHLVYSCWKKRNTRSVTTLWDIPFSWLPSLPSHTELIQFHQSTQWIQVAYVIEIGHQVLDRRQSSGTIEAAQATPTHIQMFDC